MSCCNKSRKSYLGLKSVFSRVRRKTSSLQPYICILLKSGLIPGIPQRCTSPSFSATHWQGLGWILVCRPCLCHPIADEGSTESQTSNPYRHNAADPSQHIPSGSLSNNACFHCFASTMHLTNKTLLQPVYQGPKPTNTDIEI